MNKIQINTRIKHDNQLEKSPHPQIKDQTKKLKKFKPKKKMVDFFFSPK